jgi:hypothetical protein
MAISGKGQNRAGSRASELQGASNKELVSGIKQQGIDAKSCSRRATDTQTAGTRMEALDGSMGHGAHPVAGVMPRHETLEQPPALNSDRGADGVVGHSSSRADGRPTSGGSMQQLGGDDAMDWWSMGAGGDGGWGAAVGQAASLSICPPAVELCFELDGQEEDLSICHEDPDAAPTASW